MRVMAVNTSIGNQPDKMKPTSSRSRKCILSDSIALQFARGNSFVDPSEILVNDSAGTQIQVTDFGIAHLSIGQADISSAGTQLCYRILAIEFVMKRCMREQCSVSI